MRTFYRLKSSGHPRYLVLPSFLFVAIRLVGTSAELEADWTRCELFLAVGTEFFFFLPSFTTETGSSIDATVRVSPFVEFLFFSFVFLIFKMFFLAFLPFLFRFESKECFSRVFIFFVAFFISVLFFYGAVGAVAFGVDAGKKENKRRTKRARVSEDFFFVSFLSRAVLFSARRISRGRRLHFCRFFFWLPPLTAPCPRLKKKHQ